MTVLIAAQGDVFFLALGGLLDEIGHVFLRGSLDAAFLVVGDVLKHGAGVFAVDGKLAVAGRCQNNNLAAFWQEEEVAVGDALSLGQGEAFSSLLNADGACDAGHDEVLSMKCAEGGDG